MKRGKLLGIVAVFIFNIAVFAQAATFQYQLDTEFSGGAEPSGKKPWLTAIFQDTGKAEGSLDIVQLTMSAMDFPEPNLLVGILIQTSPTCSFSTIKH